MNKEETLSATKNRLPANVSPKHYELQLHVPDFEIRRNEDGELQQNPYSGWVNITIDVLEPTDTVVLNAKELSIRDARVTLGDERTLDASISEDEETERITLQLEETLPLGEVVLALAFSSTLVSATKARGLYQSVYTYEGEERMMATTQFEPTAARRAFPCFDEPAQKATFSVSITAPEDRTVLSNTDPIEVADVGDGMKIVQFDTTPKMSTYLLAFIIGDLASVEAETKNGKTMRIWAVPDRIDKADFALDLAVRTLDFLEDYFGIDYPLSKMDNVAIPDFQAGAMENWGLVTYREYGLLVPEGVSTSIKKWATGVIPHEFVHQWFGNLATMEWWDNLWLNESFATFVGDLTVDGLYPEKNWWDEFIAQDTGRGKSLDSLRSSHPIEVPVDDEKQIDEIFDAISYSKGASVMRMLHEYAGADVFRRGAARYLSQNAYDNAKTADLLDAIDAEADVSITETFLPWIKTTGYPVVIAERDGTTLTLRQERFLLDRNPKTGTDDDTLWPIPVKITENGQEQWVVLNERSASFELGSSDSAVLINAGQSGFFRTLYSGSLLDDLVQALAGGNVPTQDRIGIFDDAYSLFCAGYLNVEQYLTLVDANRHEDNFLVWGEIIGGVVALLDLYRDHPDIAVFEQFCCELFEAKAEELGWDPEDDEDEGISQLRPSIRSALKRARHPETIATGLERFNAAAESLEAFVAAIPADMRGIVGSIAIAETGRPALERVMNLHQEARAAEGKFAPDVELSLINRLGNPKDEDLLREGLDYALNSGNVRGNDALRAFAGVGNDMREVLWKITTEELWDTLTERYGDSRAIGGFISWAASGIPSHEHADAVEAFFKENPTPAAARTIEQVVEGTRVRADRKARNEAAFTDFLNSLK